MTENPEYYKQFIYEAAKLLDLDDTKEKQFIELCKSYGLDWKL